ncbi:hypothetical protein [Halobaculum magnesiiphilum]|uniref:Uncharacterized protein n=1 Tax=Halobaculum magnesiiphilum TaxID=1017351 RepID=A0A8T8WD09_9EURY|nr:hypothetical protein [Halobaculum magnesiiphilum]QZP37747.1 hypothetical protein K6T50_00775 [Halobaculum magnesiiphilum]
MIGEFLTAFPVEAVPDGSTLIPHHATYGLLAAVVVLATVWDDHRHSEPLTEATGVLVGLFAFVVVWPWRPPIGATLAHVGPLAALAWMWRPGSAWGRLYPRRVQLVATGAILVGLDDIIEHAWPVPSPLDTGFHLLGPMPSAALATVAVAAAVYALQTAPTHNHQTTEDTTW